MTLYLSGGLAALGPGAERLPAELTDASRASPATLLAELGAAAAWAMPLRRLAGAERRGDRHLAGTPALLREAAGALAAAGGREARARSPAGPPHLARRADRPAGAGISES